MVEPAHIAITLPPFSANEMWQPGPRGRGEILTRQYRAWLQEAGWAVQIQRAGDACLHRYKLRLTAPKNRLDLDNHLKPICDLLQRQRVIRNDRYAEEIVVRRDPARADSTVLVELWAVDQTEG